MNIQLQTPTFSPQSDRTLEGTPKWVVARQKNSSSVSLVVSGAHNMLFYDGHVCATMNWGQARCTFYD